MNLSFSGRQLAISSVSEVLVWLPGVLGGLGCCCLVHRGGSGEQSEICDLDGRYGERHIIFEQNSVIQG